MNAPLSPHARASMPTGLLVLAVLLTIAGGPFAVSLVTSTAFGDVPPAARPYVLAFALLIAIVTVIVLVGLWRSWHRSRRRTQHANAQDYAASQRLQRELDTLIQQPPHVAFADGPHAIDIDGLRPLEVERHFDQVTTAHIGGWMQHSLSAMTIGIGHLLGAGGAVGLARSRIRGTSSVNLDLTGTTRADLLSDALFAVLSVPTTTGPADTVRIVVPPAAAAAEWIRGLVTTAASALIPGTHCTMTIQRYTPAVADRFTPPDVSYAVDRLRALINESGDTRIRLSGMTVANGVLIAQRLRIGDGRWLHLFPGALPPRLQHAVTTALSTPGNKLALDDN